MLQGMSDHALADQLVRIARDPELRRLVYERLGDYCHQCRNRLNSLKLSLYLAMKQSSIVPPSHWNTIDLHYQELERRVDRVQMLCRPLELSRVTLSLELLFDDRRDSWMRLMSSRGRNLEFVRPSEKSIASFDVERLGQALDSLVKWRAGDTSASRSATLRWWVDSGYVHLIWEEPLARPFRQAESNCDEEATWTLPLLARVAIAHGGEYRLQEEHGWRLEVSWPTCSPSP